MKGKSIMQTYIDADGNKIVVYNRDERPPISEEELARIAAIPDDEIDFSDIPPLTEEFWRNAELALPENKERVTMYLDRDVVDFFKRGGRGYQTRINAVLRTYVNAQISAARAQERDVRR
jgi:uncharacterized protein (DUF4415 family)